MALHHSPRLVKRRSYPGGTPGDDPGATAVLVVPADCSLERLVPPV